MSSVSMKLTLFVCRDVAGRWRSKSAEVTLRIGVIVLWFVVSTQLAPARGRGLRKQSGHQGHQHGRPGHTCFLPGQ